MKAIINARAILPDASGSFFAEEDTAVFYDEHIEKILPMQEFAHIPFTGDVLDAGGRWLAPGFLNIHIHGCAGYDTMDDDPEALPQMSVMQARHGVTGFLPTTMTYDFDSIGRALTRVRDAMQSPNWQGARVLGANMEGPFVSPAYKGAQKESNIQKADFEKIRPYADTVRIITIAPEELHGDYSFIDQCSEAGIIVSMGHTAATYEQAMDAMAHGVTHVTHLYNAQTKFHHRNPGVVGAAFDSDAMCELITDNVHVHPAAQRLAWHAKGGRNLVLITDSLRACGLGDGESELGGQKVFVKGNLATLADGTIAASVLSLNDGVRIFRDNVGITTPQAVELVTKVPAGELGILDACGSIEEGKRADFAIFDDELRHITTVIGGNVFAAGEEKEHA